MCFNTAVTFTNVVVNCEQKKSDQKHRTSKEHMM